MPKILILGLTAQGATGLPTSLLERIQMSDLLVGGMRHLSYFPDFAGETLAITNNIAQVIDRLQAAPPESRVTVLASGDPLYYGMGATLRRHLPAERLEIIPAPSSFQLAFAALGEPWADAALLSAHARPLNEVVYGVFSAPKAAILTDNQHTPQRIAVTLRQAGLPDDAPCAVCENLGGSAQRIIRTTLVEAEQAEPFAPLNVFVVWSSVMESQSVKSASAIPPPKGRGETSSPRWTNLEGQATNPPGLPDDAFSTSAKQITKREVRLLSLAELALPAHGVLWDIGAGSGSVGIEQARAQPTAQVYVIEKRPTLCEHLQRNVAKFGVENLRWQEGTAPRDIQDWPRPHAVFIGGSGGHLADLLDFVQLHLRPQGRLVLNLVTLENLHIIRELLPTAQINQVQINRAVPIVNSLRFEAMNPVFIVTWTKDESTAR